MELLLDAVHSVAAQWKFYLPSAGDILVFLSLRNVLQALNDFCLLYSHGLQGIPISYLLLLESILHTQPP